MEKIRDINQGDILAFKTADGRYKAILCTSTYKERSPYNFTFAALTYDSFAMPTNEAILETEFFGIGERRNHFYKYTSNELDRMWALHPEIKPYHLGTYGIIIWRKDFLKFRDNIVKVGNISIVDNLDKNGNGGMNTSSWDSLYDFFNERFKIVLPSNGQKTYKVRAIYKG